MTEANMINGSALVVPAKTVIWGCVAVIGVLMVGYVALFGWLAVEVVEVGRDVASIEAEIKFLREGQERIERGQQRHEDILLDILRQRNESQ